MMYIPSKYHFGLDKYLIIVSGNAHARIYLVEDSRIEKIDEFFTERPRYSDREGFFARKGFGRNFGSGSVYEDNKIEKRKVYIHQLKNIIENSIRDNNPEKVYVLGPKYLHKSIEEMIPEKLKDDLVCYIYGNFVENHPIEIVEMIYDERAKIINKKVPADRDKLRILNIGR